MRALLDQSYAGIDAPTYQTELDKIERISAANLERTPHDLRDKVEVMLAYLRTAGEILRWQAEHQTEAQQTALDPLVTKWTTRYPFLRAAIGARTPNVFDTQTALTLFWDKTNEVLRNLQVKSTPL